MTLVLSPVLNGEPNDWIQYLFWFPQFPFTVLVTNLLNKSPLEYFTANDAAAWFFLVIQCPLYFMLHMYVETIMPDNYGISKHMCFCFGCKKSSKAVDDDNIEFGLNSVVESNLVVPCNEEKESGMRRASTVKFDASDPI